MQRLNLKFSVMHTDAILKAARDGMTASKIAHAFTGKWFPVSVDEIEGICREANQFVRTRDLKRWAR